MAKKCLSEEEIKKLSSTVSADEKTFTQYFKIFQELYLIEKSTSYANFFNGINLFTLEKVNGVNNKDSLVKAITSFINEITFDKKIIQLYFCDEDKVSLALEVLKGLKDPLKYTYEITEGQERKPVDYKKFTELFKYIKKITDPTFFSDFVKEAIDNLIDVANIYHINMDYVPNDKLLKYCQKYPNRILELEAYENEDFPEITKICELNRESLTRIPNVQLDCYKNFKNIEIITINSKPIPEKLPDDFNYDTIKNLETIFLDYNIEDGEDEPEKFMPAVNLINKCKNLETLSISQGCELSMDSFIAFFKKLTCKKLKKVIAAIGEVNEQADWSEFFTNFPSIQYFDLEDHGSMEFAYAIKPVITCEQKRLPFPLLEQLIRNYITEDEGNYLTLNFDMEFKEFIDYFKDKKDIMERVKSFEGRNLSEFEIPYIQRIWIKKKDDMRVIKCKEVDQIAVRCDLDDEIKNYIEEHKPKFVEIQKGEDFNFKNTKIIYNKNTNNLIIN